MLRAEGTTPFVGLVAAVALALGRWSGSRDVVMGTPMTSRTTTELETVVGFFVNTVVLRADLTGCKTFRDVVRVATGVVLEAQDHRSLPFERLVRALNPHRDASRTALFDVLVVMHGSFETPEPSGARDVELLPHEPAFATHDLVVSLSEADGRLGGGLLYAVDQLERATAEALAKQLTWLLRAMSRGLDQPLDADLPAEGMAGGAIQDITEGLGELLTRAARRYPDLVALMDRDQCITHSELDREVRQAAAALRAAGVGPEHRVGIRLPRTIDLYVAVLATLAAGAVAVPIDSRLPPARVAYIAADAEVTHLVADNELGIEAVAVPVSTMERLRGGPLDIFEAPAREANLAYVIYTSGSTGNPKGVAVTRGNAASMVAASIDRFGVTSRERILQFVSCGFDVFMADLLIAVACGACLTITDQQTFLEDPVTTFRDLGVTFVQLPASVLSMLPAEGAEGLRAMVVGGERWANDAAERWQSRCELFNAYGPTEATVCATVARGIHPSRRAVIGHPLPSAEVRIVGDAGAELPLGMVGEISIGGPAVARGYLNRPAETAATFVPDPRRAGARAYRTGDRARRLSDDALEFLGRVDRQVKVRGFRVELEEIEHVFLDHPAVRAAAVLVRGQGAATSLVAFVASTEIDAAGLTSAVRSRLPEHMVPAPIVVRRDLPLTPNGKVDRTALEMLPVDVATARAVEAPVGDVERRLADLWDRVLGAACGDRHRSFFDAGGHSLVGLRLAALIERELGVRVPIASLLATPTLAGMAGAVERARAGGEPAATVVLGPRRPGPPMVLLPAIGGQLLAYRELAENASFPVLGLPTTSEPPWTTLDELADLQARRLLAAGGGPRVLGGWSFGGVVALATAGKLAAQGNPPRLVVAIDAHLDVSATMIPDGALVRLFLDDLARSRGTGLPAAALDGVEGLDDAVRRLAPHVEGDLALSADVLRPHFDVFRRGVRALATFEAHTIPSPILLVQAGDQSEANRARQASTWLAVAGGGLETVTIPGDHFSLLRAEGLRSLLRVLDSAWARFASEESP
jgi:amino acid adenylation domain-containing protein